VVCLSNFAAFDHFGFSNHSLTDFEGIRVGLFFERR